MQCVISMFPIVLTLVLCCVRFGQVVMLVVCARLSCMVVCMQMSARVLGMVFVYARVVLLS